MKKTCILFTGLLSALSLQPSALGQGTAFTYQGRLNDGAAPANGVFDLRFTLYSALSGGSAVGGPVTKSGTAVNNGLFNVTLDFGASVFNGSNYWLQLEVTTNGGGSFDTLSPRQPVTPAPYAEYAAGAAAANTANSVAAANITGTLPSGALGGTYSGALSLTNAANSFSGNGSGLSSLNGANLQDGSVTAAKIGGTLNASQIPNLDASKITSGTLADARLSSNVPLLSGGKLNDSVLSANVALRSGGNAFSGNQVITNGNVGIGNGAPETTLQVGSYGSPDQYLTVSSAGGNLFRSGIKLRHFNNGYGWTLVSDERDSSFRLLSHFADTNGITRMYVDRFSGNVGIGATNPANLLVVGSAVSPAYCNGTTWVNGSDRNSKEEFSAVNPLAILEKVSALPIAEWKYKVELDGARHVGPVAQDFHAAFGLNGSDDTHIATVDEGGVALAAIQGLNQKLEEKLRQKETEIAELKSRLERLEQLLNRRLSGSGQ